MVTLVTYLLCISILRSGSKQKNVVCEMLQLKSIKIYFVCIHHRTGLGQEMWTNVYLWVHGQDCLYNFTILLLMARFPTATLK